jgi:hypothetical protein
MDPLKTQRPLYVKEETHMTTSPINLSPSTPLTSVAKIQFIADYWKGLVLNGPFENQEEMEMLCKTYLSEEEGAAAINAQAEGAAFFKDRPNDLNTYHSTVAYSLCSMNLFLPSSLNSDTPEKIDLWHVALQIVGILRSRLKDPFALQCEEKGGQIHLFTHNGFHLCIPYSEKNALEKLEAHLKERPADFVLIFEQVLKLFFPSMANAQLTLEQVAEKLLEISPTSLKEIAPLIKVLQTQAEHANIFIHLAEEESKKENPNLSFFKEKLFIEAFDEDQQNRLALTYASVWLKSKEQNIVSALPSPQWLFDHLKDRPEGPLELLCLHPNSGPLWNEFNPGAPLLLKQAPTLEGALLPYALKKVRANPNPQLLIAYLNRLMEDRAAFITHGPSLIKLLEQYDVETDCIVNLLNFITDHCPDTFSEIGAFLEKHVKILPASVWGALSNLQDPLPFLFLDIERFIGKIRDKDDKQLASITSDLVKNKNWGRYLSLITNIAKQPNPLVGCFKKKFKDEGFSDEQKNEIAKAFATILVKKCDRDIINALPSVQWLFDNLLEADLVVQLLALWPPKIKVTISNPLWLAQNLSTLPDGFASFLQKNQSLLNKDDWHSAFPVLLSNFPKQAPSLLPLWKVCKKPDQNKLYSECVNASAKKTFDTIPAMILGVTAPPKPSQLEVLFSQNPKTTETLTKILDQFKKIGCKDKDKWRQFFNELPTPIDGLLLKKIFSTWSELFPLAKATKEEGELWALALTIFFTSSNILSDELWGIFEAKPGVVFARFTSEYARACVKTVLLHGTDYGWKLKDEAVDIQAETFIFHLHVFFTDVQKTLCEPWSLLTREQRLNLAHLLACKEEPPLTPLGHNHLKMQRWGSDLDNDSPILILQKFCERPYRPHDKKEQSSLLEWLDQEWKAHRNDLTLSQGINLVQYWANVYSDQANEEQKNGGPKPFHTIDQLHEKWQTVVTDQWAPSAQDKASIDRLFITATFYILNAIEKNSPVQDAPPPLFDTIHSQTKKFIKEEPRFQLQFELLYKLSFFPNPDITWVRDILKTFNTFLTMHSHLKLETIVHFSKKLPPYMEVLGKDPQPQDLDQLKAVFKTIFKTDAILSAKPTQAYGLKPILKQLCDGLTQAPKLDRCVFEILMAGLESAESVKMQNRYAIFIHGDKETLWNLSLIIGEFFLARSLPTMDSPDLICLIGSIPPYLMGNLILHLKKKCQQTEDPVSASLSLARLFWYMPSEIVQTFTTHLSNLFDLTPSFKTKTDDPYLCLSGVCWAVALNRLFKENLIKPILHKELLKQEKIFIKEFVLYILSILTETDCDTSINWIKMVADLKREATTPVIIECLKNHKTSSNMITSKLETLSQEIR